MASIEERQRERNSWVGFGDFFNSHLAKIYLWQCTPKVKRLPTPVLEGRLACYVVETSKREQHHAQRSREDAQHHLTLDSLVEVSGGGREGIGAHFAG